MNGSLANELRLYKKNEQLRKLRRVEAKAGSGLVNVLLPNYVPHPKMKAWHDAPQSHKGIKGGVRSGKTYTLCAEAVALSYLNKPFFHLSISPSFDNACETYVENLEELCTTNGLTYEWRKSANLFSIVWGKRPQDIARILVHGMDSNYKGVTAASGDLNEPFSIPSKAFKVWWERISHPRAVKLARTWGGTAEPDKMQWGWEYFEKEKENRDDFYSDTLQTYDNIHLSKDYIAGLEKIYTAKDREVYMLGKCINLGAQAVYYAFDRQTKAYDQLKLAQRLMSENCEICLSFDFNTNPMTALLGAVIKQRRYIVDEFKISKSSTRELCQLVIHRLQDAGLVNKRAHSIIITGDASGKSGSSKSNQNDYEQIMDEFGNAGIDYVLVVPESNPPVRDTVNYVNNEFEKDALYVSEKCTELMRDLELVAWKQGADGFHIDKSKKDLTHLSDCLRYFCYNTQMLVSDEHNDGRSSQAMYREKR